MVPPDRQIIQEIIYRASDSLESTKQTPKAENEIFSLQKG